MKRAAAGQSVTLNAAAIKQAALAQEADARAQVELEAKRKRGALTGAVELESSRPTREAALAEARIGKISKSEAMKRMNNVPTWRTAVVADYKSGKISYEDAMNRLKKTTPEQANAPELAQPPESKKKTTALEKTRTRQAQ
jgi:hypothetical protein